MSNFSTPINKDLVQKYGTNFKSHMQNVNFYMAFVNNALIVMVTLYLMLY